jgi:hypothetical protein
MMREIFLMAQRVMFLSILLLLSGPLAWAQYWGERVLEKSFEQTGFFFTPSYVNPYGVGAFSQVTPGLLSDPLLDFIVNPARIALDSSQTTYLYTDFRSAQEVEDQQPYPPWVYAGGMASADMSFYPMYFSRSRKELEPVFSGALIGRPAPEGLDGLLIGLTYQLVLQDDRYYGIPQDIYKSTVGYDYNGASAAAANELPIVDRYSGEDNISQTGHFVTGFARYAMPFGLDLGGKVSRVTFAREGSFGSSNFWQNSYYGTGTSLWSNLEAREQDYGHWDIAGGAQYRISNELSVGATFGYLWGSVTQFLGRDDSSYYDHSYTGGSSFYFRSGANANTWSHDGTTTYGGFDLTTRPSAATVLTFLYRRERSTVDIGVGGAILDTSYSRSSWSDNTGPSTSYSESYLSDTRAGGGTQTNDLDRITGSLRWTINENVWLSIGAILEWNSAETRTTEAVLMDSRSRYWSTAGTWDWRSGLQESKDLDWTFTAKRTNFSIPVFVNIRASDAVGILLGLNRTMTQWEADDVTLARFRYRVVTSNEGETRQENFGERYTAPTETTTDVQTTFLAGLTLRVARAFNVRLLVVPNFHETYEGTEFQDLQWWIGLTLTP